MEKVFLTDICDIQYGYAFDSKLFSDTKGKPIIRIRDIVRGYSETYTTEECPDDYIIHNDDILIGMDGEFNIALWKGGEAVLNQRVCKLIPHNEICKNYIFYYMPIALKAIEDKTPFVTVKHLSAKELNKIELPLPTYEMQNRIANSLFNLDELIEKRKKQLSKLDELVKARFVELFVNKNFPIVKLEKLCKVGSSKRIYQNEQSASGIPFLRISDLNERIDTGNKKSDLYIPVEKYEELVSQGLVPKENDILITSRGTLGKCYIVSKEDCFYFQDGMISWLSNIDEQISSKYISYLFSMPMIQEQIEKLQAGSTVAYLSIAMLKKLDINVPPIELQNQFAAFVEQTDKSKLEVQKSLEKLELLKKALMQKYFG